MRMVYFSNSEGVNGFDGGRRRGCLQILPEVGSIPATSIYYQMNLRDNTPKDVNGLSPAIRLGFVSMSGQFWQKQKKVRHSPRICDIVQIFQTRIVEEINKCLKLPENLGPI